MAYRYKEVPKEKRTKPVYIDQGLDSGREELTPYEILDKDNEVVCTVYNETDAEVLVMRLNAFLPAWY